MKNLFRRPNNSSNRHLLTWWFNAWIVVVFWCSCYWLWLCSGVIYTVNLEPVFKPGFCYWKILPSDDFTVLVLVLCFSRYSHKQWRFYVACLHIKSTWASSANIVWGLNRANPWLGWSFTVFLFSCYCYLITCSISARLNTWWRMDYKLVLPVYNLLLSKRTKKSQNDVNRY